MFGELGKLIGALFLGLTFLICTMKEWIKPQVLNLAAHEEAL
jgi:hypothetical protein